MITVFSRYEPSENIPVDNFLCDRKLKKYFNRETAAAVRGIGLLKEKVELSSEAPFYYATGLIEFEDYGIERIASESIDGSRCFSMENFVNRGITGISPLNQFKILQNMPLCFISIVFGFRGENAVVYSSIGALLLQAMNGPAAGQMIIGAGKTYKDGAVESGFALLERDEIAGLPQIQPTTEAIELFRLIGEAGC